MKKSSQKYIRFFATVMESVVLLMCALLPLFPFEASGWMAVRILLITAIGLSIVSDIVMFRISGEKSALAFLNSRLSAVLDSIVCVVAFFISLKVHDTFWLVVWPVGFVIFLTSAFHEN